MLLGAEVQERKLKKSKKKILKKKKEKEGKNNLIKCLFTPYQTSFNILWSFEI